MVVRKKQILFILFVSFVLCAALALLGWLYINSSSNCHFDRLPPKTDTHQDSSISGKRVESLDVMFPEDKDVSLEELAPGRKVAIIVMKGTWCTVCQRQLRAISSKLDEVVDSRAEVFGLSAANVDKNTALMEKLDLKFPVLSDSDGDFLREVGLWRGSGCDSATPGVVFVDESGDISFVKEGRYPGKSQTEFILERLSR